MWPGQALVFLQPGFLICIMDINTSSKIEEEKDVLESQAGGAVVGNLLLAPAQHGLFICGCCLSLNHSVLSESDPSL